MIYTEALCYHSKLNAVDVTLYALLSLQSSCDMACSAMLQVDAFVCMSLTVPLDLLAIC